MFKKFLVFVILIIVLLGCSAINLSPPVTPTSTHITWDDAEVGDDVLVGVEYKFDIEIIKSDWLEENHHAVATGTVLGNGGVAGLVEYDGEVLEVGCTYQVRGTYLRSIGILPLFVVFDVELLQCEGDLDLMVM